MSKKNEESDIEEDSDEELEETEVKGNDIWYVICYYMYLYILYSTSYYIEVETEVEPEVDTTLANSDVMTKYQEASKIANNVLNELIVFIKPGQNVLDICQYGDSLIQQVC